MAEEENQKEGDQMPEGVIIIAGGNAGAGMKALRDFMEKSVPGGGTVEDIFGNGEDKAELGAKLQAALNEATDDHQAAMDLLLARMGTHRGAEITSEERMRLYWNAVIWCAYVFDFCGPQIMENRFDMDDRMILDQIRKSEERAESEK